MLLEGILVSLRPSLCPSRIPCPLFSTYSSGWIHFIFLPLIKQLQKVCSVKSVCVCVCVCVGGGGGGGSQNAGVLVASRSTCPIMYTKHEG